MKGVLNAKGKVISLQRNTVKSLGIDISPQLEAIYKQLTKKFESGTQQSLHMHRIGYEYSSVSTLVHSLRDYVLGWDTFPSCWYTNCLTESRTYWHHDHGCDGVLIAAWPNPTQLLLTKVKDDSFHRADSFVAAQLAAGTAKIFVPEPGMLYLTGVGVAHRTNPAAIDHPHLVIRLWLNQTAGKHPWINYPKPKRALKKFRAPVIKAQVGRKGAKT